MNFHQDSIDVYHKLLEEQIRDLEHSKDAPRIRYRLFYFDKRSISNNSIVKNGYEYVIYRKELNENIVNDLIKKGFLVKIGKIDDVDIYSTLHADVVFRVLRGRAYEKDLDGRWVGYYDIDLKNEYLPDFKAVEIDRLKDTLTNFFESNNLDTEIARELSEVIIKGFRNSGFKTIADWQYKAVEKILRELKLNGFDKHYIIHAPTATGKTLVFQIVAIAYTLLQKVRNKILSQEVKMGQQYYSDYPCVLILYPRRSLQKQQMERLLKPLHFINNELKERKLEINVTIAIDRGVEQERVPGEIDTGIKCPHSDKHVIKIKYRSGEQEIICSDGTKLDYIVGIVYIGNDRVKIAESKPDILISNPWALKARLLSPDYKLSELYKIRGLVILDEAHVYSDVDDIELVASIRLLYNVRRVEEIGSTIVIGASATINLDDPRKLLSWILGVSVNQIECLDYYKLEPREGRRNRLKIIVTLLPYRLSLETLLQGVIQAVLTAISSRNLKSIVFVDSISEASTIMGYLDTIFRKREAVEICDHLLTLPCRSVHDESKLDLRPSLSIDENYFDDYTWSHLISLDHGLVKTKRNLLDSLMKLYDVIGLHHGALNEEERKLLESGFVTGSKKLLVSTSTLDLGMDYDDVTFIIQYKDPTSGEVLEQRMGRAGRKDEAARISLTFYLPMMTPILLQKIFSKKPGKSPKEDTILLPDESNIEWHYIRQVLEYEIVRILRNYINEYEYRQTITREQLRRVILNNLLTADSKLRKRLKKWLDRSKEGVSGRFMDQLYEESRETNTISRTRNEIRKVWNELRNIDRIIFEDIRKRVDKKVREFKLHIKDEKVVESIIKDVKKESRKFLNELFKSIEYCENTQDFEYSSEIIGSRLKMCIEELEKTLSKIKAEEQYIKDHLEVDLYKIKRVNEGDETYRKMVMEKIMANALLLDILNDLNSKVKQSIELVRKYLSEKYGIRAIYSALLEYRPFRMGQPCKECKITNTQFESCWYQCLRDEVLKLLGGTIVTRLVQKDLGTISLEIIRGE